MTSVFGCPANDLTLLRRRVFLGALQRQPDVGVVYDVRVKVRDVALDSHARFLAVKWVATAMLSASHLIGENGHGGEGRTVPARGPGYSDAGREGRLFARGHRDRAGEANLHRRPARPRRRR